MAGGEGTRLRPLTSNQPKPMVPVAGKPCMEHILELVRRHGITNVVATLAYMPQMIRGYFGEGSHLGIELDYSIEEVPGRHRRERQAARALSGRDVPGGQRRRAHRHRPAARCSIPSRAAARPPRWR